MKRGDVRTAQCLRCSAQWPFVIGDAQQNIDAMEAHSSEPCVGCLSYDFPDCPDED